MQEFQELISQFEALDAKVVGVSADTFASQGAFAQQNGFTFPLLSDWPNLAMMDAFGVKNEPGTSAVRSTFIFGTDSILHEVIADQDASDHAPLALEAIKALFTLLDKKEGFDLGLKRIGNAFEKRAIELFKKI